MKRDQVKELLLQSLEHERGGVKVYETALQCVLNDELKEEFEKYLEQTRNHERVLLNVFSKLGLDAEEASPGRTVVKLIGGALVEAMQSALESGKPEAAELVAAECVVLAETKDHADWELIAKCAEHLTGKEQKVLQDASDEVEDQEDEHLYHSKGWARELWLQSLGMKAMLPPPEERQHVKTAMGAARADQGSERNRETGGLCGYTRIRRAIPAAGRFPKRPVSARRRCSAVALLSEARPAAAALFCPRRLRDLSPGNADPCAVVRESSAWSTGWARSRGWSRRSDPIAAALRCGSQSNCRQSG